MTRLLCLRILIAGLTVFGAASAAAGTILPGIYTFLDHGDGTEGPAYGLRVDSLGKIFSVELNGANVTLDWTGGTTATISGTLNENSNGGNGGAGAIWTVNYVLTGVTAVGTQGFVATAASGTLTDPFNVDTILTGLPNGSGNAFEFLADGHRISGDIDTPVGRGWLVPPGTVDDWIVRAVPEPATGALVSLGLIGLAIFRRR